MSTHDCFSFVVNANALSITKSLRTKNVGLVLRSFCPRASHQDDLARSDDVLSKLLEQIPTIL